MASNEGSSKIWTVEETYRLIKAFRNHPALWKKDNSEYKNKIFRAGILELLGIEFCTNAEAIKEKLRSLRTIYGQNLKKHVKTDGTPKWEFFGALSFLKEEMIVDANDKVTDPSTNPDDNDTGSIEERYEDVSIHRKSQEPSIGAKRLRVQSPTSKHQNSTNPHLFGFQSSRNRTFGDYVALTLDVMNDALMEEKVKLQIQLLLSEAITETATSALSQLPSASQTPAYRQSPLVQDTCASVERKWRPEEPSESQHCEDGHVFSRVFLKTRTSSSESLQ